LSIVEKIISHYNGSISVQSTPNKETKFNFSLQRTNQNE